MSMKGLDADTVVQQCESGEDMRDHVKNYTLRDLVRLQLMVDDRIEELGKAVAGLRQMYDHIRIGRIPEMMAEQGDIKTITFEDIGRVTVVADMYVTLPVAERERGYKWFVDNGMDSLITETVNASTLKAWASRRVKAGEDVPEFIKVTPYQRAQITRA